VKRIFCINARGEARPVRVLSLDLFRAWLPVKLCSQCDGEIAQDLTTIHQDEPCPHCGAATFAF
jgi:hypothetical protein